MYLFTEGALCKMSAPLEVLLTSESSGQLWNACVWDISTGTSLTQYKGERTSHRGLCLLGNQYLLGASSSKPLIHVWALQRRDQHQMRIICPGRVTALTVSPDGAYCVAAIAENIHVWQVCTGNLLAVLSRHYQVVNVLRFTDNGSHFVSGGEDNLVMVWSLAKVVSSSSQRSQKPEPVRIWSSHSLPVTDVHVGGGGSRAHVVSASLDQTCKVWDMTSGELLQTLVFPTSLLSVVMDTTEYKLFAGGSTGDIYCVNMYGQPIRTERHIDTADQAGVWCFKGHNKQVTCLSVNLDGTKLASGSHDCTVRLWDVFSGQCLKTLGHKGQVTNVMIVLTPPAIADPQVKPTLPLQQFKRNLHTPEESSTLSVRIPKQQDMEEAVEVGVAGDHVTGSGDPTTMEVTVSQMDNQGDISTTVHRQGGILDRLSSKTEELNTVKALNKDLYLFTLNKLLGNKT